MFSAVYRPILVVLLMGSDRSYGYHSNSSSVGAGWEWNRISKFNSFPIFAPSSPYERSTSSGSGTAKTMKFQYLD